MIRSQNHWMKFLWKAVFVLFFGILLSEMKNFFFPGTFLMCVRVRSYAFGCVRVREIVVWVSIDEIHEKNSFIVYISIDYCLSARNHCDGWWWWCVSVFEFSSSASFEFVCCHFFFLFFQVSFIHSFILIREMNRKKREKDGERERRSLGK